MNDSRKVVIVKSTGTAGDQGMLYWMFSRKQLEMVLREIEPAPVLPVAKEFCEAAIVWQNEILPVVCLEKYFGLTDISVTVPGKHLILKAAAQDEKEIHVSMIVLPVYTDLQMGSLSGVGKRISPDFLNANSSDVLGAFEIASQRIVVLPDICKIALRSRAILQNKG